MRLYIIVLLLSFFTTIQAQISHTFTLYEFRYAKDKDFNEIGENNIFQIYTLPDNNNIAQLFADAQLETFDINSYIYNYQYLVDSCNNITISFKIKKKHRYHGNLNVIITKDYDKDYYLINIFRRFIDFDIYFKAHID